MPSFLVLGIYLLLLFGDGEGAGCNRFLHGGSVEDEDDNYGVNNFIGMTTWRPFFSGGDIKAEMMSLPWNKFLRSPLRFVVVTFGHDEGLGRIIFRSVFLNRWWQKEGRHKKKELSQLQLQGCWPSFAGHTFSGLLTSVCLCGHPYKASSRFGVEIWSYSQCGYNLDENLDICSVFQSVCNVLIYPAII